MPSAWAPVVQQSLCFWLCTGSTCAALQPALLLQRENKQTSKSGPLLPFDCISLGLGRSKISSKLTNLFPDFFRAFAGASLYPIPFLNLLRLTLSYFILYPDFPRLDSSPSRSPSQHLLSMCPAKEIPPYCFITPPDNLQEGADYSLGKLENRSCLPIQRDGEQKGVNHLGRAMLPSPEVCRSCGFQT